MNLIVIGAIDFRDRVAIVAPSHKQNCHDPDEKREPLINHSRRVRGQRIARSCAERKNGKSVASGQWLVASG